MGAHQVTQTLHDDDDADAEEGEEHVVTILW